MARGIINGLIGICTCKNDDAKVVQPQDCTECRGKKGLLLKTTSATVALLSRQLNQE